MKRKYCSYSPPLSSKGRIPLSAKMLNDGARNPVIIATTLAFPEEKLQRLEESGHKVLILAEHDGRVDLNQLMIELGKLGIDGILLEGGGTLNESALKSGIVDEIQFILAPLLLGGRDAITPIEGAGFNTIDEGIRLHHITTSRIGDDILVTGRVIKTLND